MTARVSRDPRTATQEQSIWQAVPEDVFRRHVVQLELCTNAVPIAAQRFRLNEGPNAVATGEEHSLRLLPLQIEQQLADDLALIVAVEEGAQSVAAVCVEEHVGRAGLTIRFAAVDIISKALQQTAWQVMGILRDASKASTSTGSVLTDTLFTLIVQQHHARILGRLRSSKWQKPVFLSRSHKKPLWQDFANLIHRVQFLYTKKERKRRELVEFHLQTLEDAYKAFEGTCLIQESELEALKDLVKISYDFCLSPAVRDYAARLENLPSATSQIATAVKSLHQIEKIAAYQRVPRTLIQCASRYASLFQNIKIEYIVPFSPVNTSIAYETWAKLCHVHAEVQMAVYYDIEASAASRAPAETGGELNNIPSGRESTHLPRCIGTSKHLCYLCFLFMTQRNEVYFHSDHVSSVLSGTVSSSPCFQITNTHGRLYDQWTIPDLAQSTSAGGQRYQAIIIGMVDEIVLLTQQVHREIELTQQMHGQARGNGKKRAKDGALVNWRIEPMTSREYLLAIDEVEQAETPTSLDDLKT